MEKLLLIAAVIVLIGGALLLAAPKVLIKADEMLNRLTTTDSTVLSKRYIVGVLLVLAGIFMVYSYFWLL